MVKSKKSINVTRKSSGKKGDEKGITIGAHIDDNLIEGEVVFHVVLNKTLMLC